MGELRLTGLDEAVMAQLSSRAEAHGRSVDEEASAILLAEVSRLNTAPKIGWDLWLAMAEDSRRQWTPLDVSMTELIREGRDER